MVGRRSNKFGRTALHWVAGEGNVSMARLLLENKAQPNIMDDFSGATALHCALNGCHEETVLLLLDNGADPNAERKLSSDLLSPKWRFLILISKGSEELRSECTAGEPLLWAVFWEETSMITLLLDRGADPNLGAAFFYAARRGKKDTIEMLLRKGANPNCQDKFGQTALFYTEDVDVAKMLLDAGCDVNITDLRNRTALHEAADCFDEKMVNLLLSEGADPNAKDEEEMIPLQKAESKLLQYKPKAKERNEEIQARFDRIKESLSQRAIEPGSSHAGG
ncbi:hypothetical protein EKO27_g3197 [Xylaria grammica]|uniref:Uncharacterized protein n=1 Tax=Xylaria grammica TaxID=363999 RepID=A0A439DBY5_9PEZI|nr:hypothetical protein EKO27_g3197 [Xylaria grammica]